MISLVNNKLNLEKVFREHIWGNSCFLYKVNFKYTCIMATTNFKGQPVKLIGEFIQVGKVAPDFELVKTDQFHRLSFEICCCHNAFIFKIYFI